METNQQLPSNTDDQACDRAGGWLGIQSHDLVLNLLEWECLCKKLRQCGVCGLLAAYRELFDDSRSTQDLSSLESQHRGGALWWRGGDMGQIIELGGNGQDIDARRDC